MVDEEVGELHGAMANVADEAAGATGVVVAAGTGVIWPGLGVTGLPGRAC